MNQTTNAGIDLNRDQVLELMVEHDMLSQIGYRALLDGDSLDANLNYLTQLVNLARRAEPSVTEATNERALFEAWFVAALRRTYPLMPESGVQRMLSKHEDGTYTDLTTQHDWSVWQASVARAALASPAVSQKDGAAVEPKCKTCDGMGVVDDGEIDCYPNGEPFMCGPVKCVKDCPDCTSVATLDTQVDKTTASASASTIKTWQERKAEYEGSMWQTTERAHMEAEIADLRAALARAPLPAEGEAFDLHNAIMNLPDNGGEYEGRERTIYKIGHRDARHAAAELSLAAPAQAGDAQDEDTERLDYIASKAVRGATYQGVTSVNVIVHEDDLAMGGVRYAIDCMRERAAMSASQGKKGGA